MRANPDEETAPPQGAGDGGLAELIELERRLERELTAARREAQQRVEAARRETQQHLAGSDADLDAALSSLRDASRRRCEEELRAIESAGARGAAAFDALAEERLDQLARFVAARLAGREEPA